ncbi:MAG: cupin domain-containing protein [Lachnospiraceae bacterium]
MEQLIKSADPGATPYAVDIVYLAENNINFRTAVWTGNNLQMTLMCIPPCGDIGMEVHPDTDQFIRIEQGRAVVIMEGCDNSPDYRRDLCKGDGIFVPAGTRHNIVNTGRCPLKVSSIYAPPHHSKGIVQRFKED